MDFDKIKLIIWDLDETFWRGTLSEGDVQPISSNVALIHESTDAGVVNSICSKNDLDAVKNKMIELNLWDYFVFPSVDWSSKGSRIKNLIDGMKLRYENVLFVDDNIQNLEEAKHFCPGLMTLMADELPALSSYISQAEKKDKEHKRLKQYHVLEEKEASRSSFSSNDEFLMSCDIRVEISNDCLSQLDRIADLIIRSNQLNFTKIRSNKEELIALLDDPEVEAGYVSAKDRFGDYGIIGFFAVKGGKAIHFVFSCRTLGMQIEQYVYVKLGCPEINISGSVVSVLRKDFLPPWINQKQIKIESNGETKNNVGKILIKGPCDMSQMYSFLNGCKNLRTEFSYTNECGVLTEGHNHTAQIVTALFATEEEKKRILDSFPSFDHEMFNTALKTDHFDCVILSMLTDGNLGVYRHKKTKRDVALCEKYYDLTDPKNENGYVTGDIFTSGFTFNHENLKKFSDDFERVTDTSWDSTIINLGRIYEYLGAKTKLILILGSERKFAKVCNASFNNRNEEHKSMNAKIAAWAKNKPNVKLVHLDDYIKSESDYLDTINHFVKRVYYDLAGDLVNEVSNDGGANIKLKSKVALLKSELFQKLISIKHRIFKK